MIYLGKWKFVVERECETCGGDGRVLASYYRPSYETHRCPDCDGDGVVDLEIGRADLTRTEIAEILGGACRDLYRNRKAVA